MFIIKRCRSPFFCTIFLTVISIELLILFIYLPNLTKLKQPQSESGSYSEEKERFEQCRHQAGGFFHLLTKWNDKYEISKWHRDFKKQPLRIGGSDQVQSTLLKDCPVPCWHYPPEYLLRDNETNIYFDASFVEFSTAVLPKKDREFLGFTVLRTMESSVYIPMTALEKAKEIFDIVMTPRLDSDVPVPYFSWELYDFMKPLTTPVQKRSKTFLSSIFLSNCDGQSMRNKVIEIMKESALNYSSKQFVQMFGLCSDEQRRYDGDKLLQIGKFKFHLAFENSIDIDYVTEKFFQPLVEGSIPVVIGAPNIADFSPAPDSMLVIKDVADVGNILKQMKEIDRDDEQFNRMVQWKTTGVSNHFLALVDLANVHSSCRLCINVADRIRAQERKRLPKLSCFCSESGNSGIYRYFVRERGHFEYIEAYLISNQLTLAQLGNSIITAFQNSHLAMHGSYWPIWTKFRDRVGRREVVTNETQIPELRLYRIYKSFTTNQKIALLNDGDNVGQISNDVQVADLFEKSAIEDTCLELEVIFI